MAGKTNELILAELENELKDAQFLFLSSFSRLKVADLQDLRLSLSSSGRRCMVIKNSLARIVLKKMGHDQTADLIDGMSCFTTSESEPQMISKALVEFSKSHEDSFNVLGALLDGKSVSVDYVKQLAKLPGKNELRAQVVGRMKGPINGFVLNLKGLLQSLVIVLNAAKEKNAAASGV